MSGTVLGTRDSVVNKIEALLSRDYILVEELNKCTMSQI